MRWEPFGKSSLIMFYSKRKIKNSWLGNSDLDFLCKAKSSRDEIFLIFVEFFKVSIMTPAFLFNCLYIFIKITKLFFTLAQTLSVITQKFNSDVMSKFCNPIYWYKCLESRKERSHAAHNESMWEIKSGF